MDHSGIRILLQTDGIIANQFQKLFSKIHLFGAQTRL